MLIKALNRILTKAMIKFIFRLDIQNVKNTFVQNKY